jgi:hypothetical protein
VGLEDIPEVVFGHLRSHSAYIVGEVGDEDLGLLNLFGLSGRRRRAGTSGGGQPGGGSVDSSSGRGGAGTVAGAASWHGILLIRGGDNRLVFRDRYKDV